jgi:Flp pilus assembly protein TadG
MTVFSRIQWRRSIVGGQEPATCGDRRTGAAALELALILPVLLLLTLGAVDYGRFSYSWIAVANASRAAAGFASVQPVSPTSQGAWQAGIRQAAQAELEGLPGFDPSQMTVTAELLQDDGGRQRAFVTVGYPFRTLFPWGGIPATLMLQQSTAMPVVR